MSYEIFDHEDEVREAVAAEARAATIAEVLAEIHETAEYHRRREHEQTFDESYAHAKVAREMEALHARITALSPTPETP